MSILNDIRINTVSAYVTPQKAEGQFYRSDRSQFVSRCSIGALTSIDNYHKSAIIDAI